MSNLKLKNYSKPNIEIVCLDNQISLQLASGIPVPGDAYNSQTPDCLQQNPYKVQSV